MEFNGNLGGLLKNKKVIERTDAQIVLPPVFKSKP